jgi:hypothetical protein
MFIILKLYKENGDKATWVLTSHCGVSTNYFRPDRQTQINIRQQINSSNSETKALILFVGAAFGKP